MAQVLAPRKPYSGPSKQRQKGPFLLELWRSTTGKKYLMAITGVIGMAFVFGHMVGNLKMYLGPEEFNHYAEFLRELLVPIMPRTVALWLLRGVLIISLVVHVSCAYSLTMVNRRARPVGYQSPRDYIAANWASRTMRWTGVIVLLFLAFHLSDLTWGFANPDFERGLAYQNLAASLDRWPVAILYMVSMIALGFHLWHGGWSLFQSLGLNNPRLNKWRRWFADGFALVIVIPNLSVPIAVLAGIVG